ncbi:MAG TPA: hypothetical protein VJU61_14865 [Polyangiaceae bacterium]|nr:hypothetical protein [Polyangiaceae bacterium]
MGAEAEPEVHGKPPLLAAQLCEELLCEQYWYQGALAEPANVIHLRFASEWHRLCFDYGAIFWRLESERPAPYTMPELQAETKLDNLGARLDLAGRALHAYESRVILGGSEVEFRFEGGVKVVFRNVDDHTAVIIEEHAPSKQ